MSWQEREYRDEKGQSAWRKALRRVFGDTNNILSWSVPLFRLSRIDVRIHIFYVLYILIRIITSIGDSHSFIVSVIAGAVLFTLVLLHEFGHCLACRWVKGEASEIIMWPLGGLAMCHPPKTWRANLVTTAGGPMVNVVLVPVLALVLLTMGASTDLLVFNPLKPDDVLKYSPWLNGPINYLRFTVWIAYFTNLVLLAFNVLLPMFPMDGGRLLQEFLWAKQGYRRSMQTATTVGLVCAVVLAMFAMTMRSDRASNDSTMNLFSLALFCGFICWHEKRLLAVSDDAGSPGYDFAKVYKGVADDESEAEKILAASKRRVRAAEEESRRQQEVDRILAKIRESGMSSLTRKEEQTLRGETERRRGAR